MFLWDLTQGDLICTTEPVYDNPYPDTPTPLSDFLIYLEGRGHVDPQIECHSAKRKMEQGSSMPTFTVTISEKVGFKAKAVADKNAKGVFTNLTPEGFCSESDKVRVVNRCKFVEKDRLIVPQRPVVMLKGSYIIPANAIIKMNTVVSTE